MNQLIQNQLTIWLTIDKPSFARRPEPSVIYEVGARAELRCHVVGFPAPSVQWRRDVDAAGQATRPLPSKLAFHSVHHMFRYQNE